MRSAVIVDAVPVASGKGKPGGVLSETHPVDLFAHVLRSLVERNGLDPARVDDVIGGCVIQAGEQGLNISRQALLAAGFPETVPATTVDRQCGSSQQAAHFRVAVNCAGTGNAITTVSKKGPHPLADFSRIINNLVGSFNVIRLAAARTAERDLIDSERGATIELARPSDSTAQSVWLRVNQAWKCRVLSPGRDQKPKNQQEYARA